MLNKYFQAILINLSLNKLLLKTYQCSILSIFSLVNLHFLTVTSVDGSLEISLLFSSFVFLFLKFGILLEKCKEKIIFNCFVTKFEKLLCLTN